MTANFFYYRCPCPSADCNGSICRYQDIVTAPVPSQYPAPSRARFTAERKILSYQTTPKETSSTVGKYDSIPTPMTITRDNFRWTPYPSQSRLTQESSTPARSSPERSKLNPYELGYELFMCFKGQCAILYWIPFLCQRRTVARVSVKCTDSTLMKLSKSRPKSTTQ